MGSISRHAGAPFVTGEVLQGTSDLEVDLNAIVSEVNGSLDNGNFSAAAGIVGAQISDASIPGEKFSSNTVTVSKIIAAAVPKHYIAPQLPAPPVTWTSSTTLVDFTDVAAATLTPGSTSDMIFMEVQVRIDSLLNEALTATIGWSVNGTDYDDITDVLSLPGSGAAANIFDVNVVSRYAIRAPAITPITIKPRHKRASGSTQTLTIENVLFSCWILPGK